MTSIFEIRESSITTNPSTGLVQEPSSETITIKRWIVYESESNGRTWSIVAICQTEASALRVKYALAKMDECDESEELRAQAEDGMRNAAEISQGCSR